MFGRMGRKKMSGERSAGTHIRLPAYGQALLDVLSFENCRFAKLLNLSQSSLDALVSFCDCNQLTLLLRHLARPHLPDRIRLRMDRNYQDFSLRFIRLQAAVLEIARSFENAEIDLVLLKGFGQVPEFTPDPMVRAQGDVDIWCLPAQIDHAHQALRELGYRSVGESESRHLAPMIREKTWTWTGDYFAPDLPIPIDLHYRLWDEDMEGIRGPRESDFWQRRSSLPIGGQNISVLDEADTLAFAAVHLLMHLLHGDLRLNRAWEIGYFLNSRSEDELFWTRWQNMFPEHLRQLQVLIFALVQQWFACRVPDIVDCEIRTLAPDLKLWIRHFGWSPVEALFAPNKDELWLHMALLTRRADRRRVLFRRLFPAHAKVANMARSSGRPGAELTFLWRRTLHHARTLVSSGAHGVKWWRLKRATRQFA
jgi:hypothetical protein